MKARGSIEIVFPDKKSLDAACESLSHEGDVGGRSRISISKKGLSLKISIEAADVVALRASANACLRALQVFESIEEVRI